MSKNVVVCCDGTANQIAAHNTNVVKLFSALVQDPARQVNYYHPGLGTREASGALTTFARKLTKVLGMAFGYGLADDVRDAYVFLMRSFEPGDRVFLFGFSRGAYTVRAVASLLHMYGLVARDNESLVPYAIRMMTAINRGQKSGQSRQAAVDEYFALARTFKAAVGRTDCRPAFVGVWDTVNSIGWIENPLRLPFVADNPDIAVGRHAVSIDERRAFFRSHLWEPSPARQVHGPIDVQQVWFPGVHCDVGGGFAEDESGPSNAALEWMLVQAQAAGLMVDPSRLAPRRPPGAPAEGPPALHESLRGWWHLAEFVPKRRAGRDGEDKRWRMNLYRRRTMPEHALVHESAFARGADYCRRLPRGAVKVSRAAVGAP
jgi:uncharacterized protein (DUF2235 family)